MASPLAYTHQPAASRVICVNAGEGRRVVTYPPVFAHPSVACMHSVPAQPCGATRTYQAWHDNRLVFNTRHLVKQPAFSAIGAPVRRVRIVGSSVPSGGLSPQLHGSYDLGKDSQGSDASVNGDPQLELVKELCYQSGLRSVPVAEGLSKLMEVAGADQLSKVEFLSCYDSLLQARGIQVPPPDVQEKVFSIFDRDGNGVVDLMELISGMSLLCGGSDDEKIEAVFNAFDEDQDGFISLNEMFKFMTSVFRVGLTPQLLSAINSMGATVASPEELASVTALQCFREVDLNKDGKLSVDEFKAWFFAPDHDPAMLFSPIRCKY